MLATGVLTMVSGAATAIADAPGSGGSGGTTPPSSPCSGPGVQQVSMIAGAIDLGLPLQVDPSTQSVTLTNAVVCYHAGSGDSAGDASGEALVVQAPDDQAASFQLGATCTPDQGAAVQLQCAPTMQPLVEVDPSDTGASSMGSNSVGLDVAVPIRLCASGQCTQDSPELVPAVVAGRLECTDPPSGGAPTEAGAICLWYGLQVSADGVPVTGLVPGDADTGPMSTGGWAEAPLAAGAQVVTVSDGCDPENGDATTCQVDASRRYVWAQYGPGPTEVFVVPTGQTPMLVPAPQPSVSATLCYQTAGANACPKP